MGKRGVHSSLPTKYAWVFSMTPCRLILHPHLSREFSNDVKKMKFLNENVLNGGSVQEAEHDGVTDELPR